ncbi:hypothetical protein [Azomonas macrocytogenes]|uniref:Uncharacterized protein n=1 Tax=Azomonas macrocytogenes TaxID=69962 RepID=A0A839T3G0_AZOMA|nr:hypothetical protein [Azomonas macrocytogenes]MBB3103006.1 hypothetical protein [Azomonas macrocytogenes]
MKAQITERALVARVNRKLTPRDTQLKRCSIDSTRHAATGSFYQIDLATGRVIADHLDLEAMARKIGVLADWEELEQL